MGKIMIIAAVIGMVFGAVHVNAQMKNALTDTTCMVQCMNEGHMYNYCQRICSY